MPSRTCPQHQTVDSIPSHQSQSVTVYLCCAEIELIHLCVRNTILPSFLESSNKSMTKQMRPSIAQSLSRTQLPSPCLHLLSVRRTADQNTAARTEIPAHPPLPSSSHDHPPQQPPSPILCTPHRPSPGAGAPTEGQGERGRLEGARF